MLDRNIAKYDVNHIVDDKERKKLKNWTMERLTNWINYKQWLGPDNRWNTQRMPEILKYGYTYDPRRKELNEDEYNDRFNVALRRKRQREAQKAAQKAKNSK